MNIAEYYALVREMNKVTCYKTIMDLTYNYYKYHFPSLSLLELATAFNRIHEMISVDGVDKVVADISKVFTEHEANLRDTIIPIIMKMKDKQNSKFIEGCMIDILNEFDKFDNNQARSGIIILDKISTLCMLSRHFEREYSKQVINVYESILLDLSKIAKLRFDAA